MAKLQAIEYLSHAEAMLQDNVSEREIRLVLSGEPEPEVNVSITPIKRHGGSENMINLVQMNTLMPTRCG